MICISIVIFMIDFYEFENVILIHFHCVPSRRQLLLCRVALGKSFLQYSAMKMAHAPPGHHSVIGRPSAGGLHFAEYVVYRGEQVIYEKKKMYIYYKY